MKTVENQKTIIIGGGCAGLSVAKHLSEKGIHNVTILEKSNRPGGKCTSKQYDEGWHELATSYSAWGYHTLQRWMNQYHVPIYKIKMPNMVEDEHTQKVVSLREYTIGGSTFKHKKKAIKNLVKFQKLWLKFFFHELRGSKNKAMNEELAKPFGKWLDDHNLEVIKRLAGRAIVSAGYGYLESIPTIHCLRWLKPSIMIAGLFGQIWEPAPGFENFWKMVSWNFDVRYNTIVKSITKQEGKLIVENSDGTVHEADNVVIAVPMSEAKNFFEEDTETYEICSKMKSHKYSTIVFKCKEDLFDDENHEAVGLPYNFGEDKLGKALVIRRTGEKTPTMFSRKSSRSQYYISYHYKYELPEEELVESLKKEVESLGSEVSEILDVTHFNYMQTYDKESIQDGLVEELNQIQGKDNIWFNSASVSFESVENIIDTAEEIVSLIRTKNDNKSFSYRWLRFSRLFKTFTFIPYWIFAIKRT